METPSPGPTVHETVSPGTAAADVPRRSRVGLVAIAAGAGVFVFSIALDAVNLALLGGVVDESHGVAMAQVLSDGRWSQARLLFLAGLLLMGAALLAVFVAFADRGEPRRTHGRPTRISPEVAVAGVGLVILGVGLALTAWALASWPTEEFTHRYFDSSPFESYLALAMYALVARAVGGLTLMAGLALMILRRGRGAAAKTGAPTGPAA